jgi:DNA-binding CsgD family transcriptional regulator
MTVVTAYGDFHQLNSPPRQGKVQAPHAELAMALMAIEADLDGPFESLLLQDLPLTEPQVVTDLLDRLDAARAEAAHRMLRRPLMAARRVNVAVDRLHAAASYDNLVLATPAELCWAGDFDRVLFSRVEGSTWSPTSWHAMPSSHGPVAAAFGKFIHGARMPLTGGTIEAEVVRRRVSAVVRDTAIETRAWTAIVDIALSESYVIAPVVSGETVVGLLHADAHTTGRRLTETDRVTLQAFADGMGLTMERIELVERLSAQRTEIQAALKRAAGVVDDICSEPMTLDYTTKIEETTPPTRIGERPDDGLTSREREVFALLVGGATNGQIADRLTVSETTVKSHVKHILRKLKVSNRAEALSQYLMLNGRPGPA